MVSMKIIILLASTVFAQELILPSIQLTRTGFNQQNSLKKRDIGDEALISDNNKLFYAFLGTVSFGTPPQNFTVMFDTGSFKTWVRSSKCATSYCGVSFNSFHGSKSSTYKDTGVAGTPITYADGSGLNGYKFLTLELYQ